MEITAVRTEADHERTLREIEGLMMAKAGTPEGDRLDVLVTLVEAYEQKNFPIDLPDAVSAIQLGMERTGKTLDDLVPVFGRKNRAYEIMAGKRPLSLPMIEKLHLMLRIPAESLLRQRYKRVA